MATTTRYIVTFLTWKEGLLATECLEYLDTEGQAVLLEGVEVKN